MNYEARTKEGILFRFTAYSDAHAYTKARAICGHEPPYVGRS